MSNVSIKEIRPNIFWANFDNQYDLAMTFCRYQEFYESDNKDFCGKSFLLLDFMAWYAKNHDDIFTYTKDWNGFNLPVEVIDNANAMGIKDRNKYDKLMSKICAKIKYRPAYLIGTNGNDALSHEIAHGLFYTNQDYRKEMKKLVKQLDSNVKDSIFNYLTNLGYAKHVQIDECQAYLATGISLPDADKIRKAQVPFIETFKQYE